MEISNLQKSILSRLRQQEIDHNVHWLCNGQPVFTKFQAMTNLSHGQPTSFYFFDQSWAQADWSRASSTSFQDLLIERALQIRRRYSYVRLAYSGGSDCHTALMAFKMAGVAPDEIYTYTMVGEAPALFNDDFELLKGVFPFWSTLQQWFPNTKLQRLNIDYDWYRAFKLLDVDHSAYEISTGLRSLNTAGLLSLFDHMPLGPDICTVSGSDKPRLDYINNNWYVWFTDVGCCHAWGNSVEPFFQSADPALFIKQAHMLKNFIKSQLPELTRKKIYQFQAQGTIAMRQACNDALGRYRTFDPVVVSPKYSKQKFRVGERGLKAYCLWRKIRHLSGGPEFLSHWEQTKQDFKNRTGYCPTVEVFGKFYNLDTGEIHTVDDLFPRGWSLD